MAAKIVIRLDIEEEDMPFVGNCSAIDPETDRQAEEWIQQELDRGNQAAWCVVIVTARCEGFTGKTALGGCSYESVEALKKDLLDTMQIEAIKDLRNSMKEAIKTARSATELLPQITRKLLPIEYED